MANMSYCRFQNTARDLDDCLEHINDEDMSKDERRARARLISLCEKILAEQMELEEEPKDESNDNKG